MLILNMFDSTYLLFKINIVSLLTELTDTKKIMFKSLTYSNSFDDDPSNFVLAIC